MKIIRYIATAIATLASAGFFYAFMTLSHESTAEQQPAPQASSPGLEASQTAEIAYQPTAQVADPAPSEQPLEKDEGKLAEDVAHMRRTMSYPPSRLRSATLRAEATGDPAAAQIVLRDIVAAQRANDIERAQVDAQGGGSATQ